MRAEYSVAASFRVETGIWPRSHFDMRARPRASRVIRAPWSRGCGGSGAQPRSAPWSPSSLRSSSARSGSFSEVAAALVLAAAFPDVGIGLLGVSLAFGLTVVSGAYALGPISGGHFNPAVSVGLWVGGRFPIDTCCCHTPWRRSSAASAAQACCTLIASGTRGFQPGRRVRLQRLRRALTGRVFACGGTRRAKSS